MNACQRNDSLLRKMLVNGDSIEKISKAVGTNPRWVQRYIAENEIPHEPYSRGRKLEKNKKWRGGRIIDEDGYILLKTPGHPNADRHNYVREHRLVMEKHLGRYLDPKEVVHHKDHNKQNNCIENLEIYPTNAKHLATELKGKIPCWTEDGKRRISEGVRKSISRRQTSILKS